MNKNHPATHDFSFISLSSTGLTLFLSLTHCFSHSEQVGTSPFKKNLMITFIHIADTPGSIPHNQIIMSYIFGHNSADAYKTIPTDGIAAHDMSEMSDLAIFSNLPWDINDSVLMRKVRVRKAVSI